MDSLKDRSRHSYHSNHSLNRQHDNYYSSNRSNSKSTSTSPPRTSSSRELTRTFYECRVCLNTYPNKQDLHAHLINAQHLRPYKSLFDNETLAIHSQKRKYDGHTCKVCSEDFNTNQELRIHLSRSGHYLSNKRPRLTPEKDSRRQYEEPRRRSSTSNDSRSVKSSSRGRSPVCNNNNSEKGAKKRASSLSGNQSPSPNHDSVDVVQQSTTNVVATESQGEVARLQDAESTSCSQIVVISGTQSADIVVENQTDVNSPENVLSQPSVSEEIAVDENRPSIRFIPLGSPPYLQTALTTDPRRYVANDTNRFQQPGTNQAKWVPHFIRCPTPKPFGKKWCLIPIDLPPKPCIRPSPKPLTSRIPSPLDDTMSAEIDQLAAKLKENPGATFIPVSLPVDGSAASFSNYPATSAQELSSSTSGECSRSSTPFIYEPNGEEETDSDPQPSTQISALNQDNNTLLCIEQAPTSTVEKTFSWNRCDDRGMSSENLLTGKGSRGSMPDVVPMLDFQPITCPTETIDVPLSEGEPIPAEPLAIAESPVALSIPQNSPQDSICNTQNPNSSKPLIVETEDDLLPNLDVVQVPSIFIDETCLIKCEEVGVSLFTTPSPSPSPSAPYDHLKVVDQAQDECFKCETVFDLTRLTVNLKSKDVTVTCKECGAVTIMKRVLHKMF